MNRPPDLNVVYQDGYEDGINYGYRGNGYRGYQNNRGGYRNCGNRGFNDNNCGPYDNYQDNNNNNNYHGNYSDNNNNNNDRQGGRGSQGGRGGGRAGRGSGRGGRGRGKGRGGKKSYVPTLCDVCTAAKAFRCNHCFKCGEVTHRSEECPKNQ